MASTQFFVQSGGIGLVSGTVFSGTYLDLKSPNNSLAGGVQLKLAAGAPGIVYVGVPNLSGDVITFLSGGSLSSGGMSDAMELSPGDSYFIPKSRMSSGIESVILIGPAASSGGRVFWDIF